MAAEAIMRYLMILTYEVGLEAFKLHESMLNLASVDYYITA
jgi:hypothetical protein